MTPAAVELPGEVGWATAGDVGIATIDRPRRRNALDAATCDELRALLTRHRSLRAVIISGAGAVFSSGADLKADPEDRARLGDAMVVLLDQVAEYPAPVIAAVNGPAIGLGALLALSCDLRVGSATATFEVPAARLGRTLTTPLIERLVTAVGVGGGKRLLLGNDVIGAEAALALGLLHRLSDPALDAAKEFAQSVLALSAEATANHKRELNRLDVRV